MLVVKLAEFKKALEVACTEVVSLKQVVLHRNSEKAVAGSWRGAAVYGAVEYCPYWSELGSDVDAFAGDGISK